MNIMRILRHPRAAVIIHDLVMVAVSWLAAEWIVNRGGVSGIIAPLPLAAELILVLAVQGAGVVVNRFVQGFVALRQFS